MFTLDSFCTVLLSCACMKQNCYVYIYFINRQLMFIVTVSNIMIWGLCFRLTHFTSLISIQNRTVAALHLNFNVSPYQPISYFWKWSNLCDRILDMACHKKQNIYIKICKAKWSKSIQISLWADFLFAVIGGGTFFV